MQPVTRQTIRAQLKGLVIEKKALNFMRMAHKATPPEQKQSTKYQRWFYPMDCRRERVRHQTRHVLLAYAYLRGVPYRVLEARCRPDNQPEVQAIVSVLGVHGRGGWTVREDIRRWLEVLPESEAECKAA